MITMITATSSAFSSRDLMTDQEALGIIIASTVILIANILLTTTTLIIITITGQRASNTSNRIIFYLAMSDLATALYRSLILLLVIDYQKRVFKAPFEITAQFITCQVAYLSAYIVVVLALDRFLHVKYLTEINTKFTNTHVDILAGCGLFISTMFAGNSIVETVFPKRFDSLRFVRYIFNTTLLIMAISLYLMTMHTMRRYTRQAVHKTNLQKLNKTVTVASSACMFSIALFYTPIGSILVLRALLDQRVWRQYHLELYFHIAILFAQLNTIFNATMYMVVNRKAKKVLMTLFKRGREDIS